MTEHSSNRVHKRYDVEFFVYFVTAVDEYNWLLGEFRSVLSALSLKTAKYRIDDDFPAKTDTVVLSGSTGQFCW